jgi:hypothetical protein
MGRNIERAERVHLSSVLVHSQVIILECVWIAFDWSFTLARIADETEDSRQIVLETIGYWTIKPLVRSTAPCPLQLLVKCSSRSTGIALTGYRAHGLYRLLVLKWRRARAAGVHEFDESAALLGHHDRLLDH